MITLFTRSWRCALGRMSTQTSKTPPLSSSMPWPQPLPSGPSPAGLQLPSGVTQGSEQPEEGRRGGHCLDRAGPSPTEPSSARSSWPHPPKAKHQTEPLPVGRRALGLLLPCLSLRPAAAPAPPSRGGPSSGEGWCRPAPRSEPGSPVAVAAVAGAWRARSCGGGSSRCCSSSSSLSRPTPWPCGCC